MRHSGALLLAVALLLWPMSASLAEAADVTTEEVDTVFSDVDEASSQTETPIEESERPEFVRWLLDVAIGELGYTEGPNNESKYGEWSGDAHAAWCAEFVCWCVDQVDQRHGTHLLNEIYPNYSGQNTGRDWFITKGRFVYRKGNCPGWGYQWLRGTDHFMKKNDYIPRSGDLMFFSYNDAGDTEHVALVEYSAYAADGSVIVHVIEGNNPSAVQRNSYTLNNSQVLGFGACEDVVDTTIRSACTGDKVLVLQQRLFRLGFLEERHLTGSFGGNTSAAVAAWQRTMEGKTVTGIADLETQQSIEAAILEIEFNTPDTWLVTEE